MGTPADQHSQSAPRWDDSPPPAVYVLATLDTKGDEAAFVRDQLAARGGTALLVDVGSGGDPRMAADIPREAFSATAGHDITQLQAARDRGRAIQAAVEAARRWAIETHASGRMAGILALG